VGGALAGCPADGPAPPYELTVRASALGLTDVVVVSDNVEIADADTSVPIVRAYDNHADALAALPFALVVYQRGVTQSSLTIAPGAICDGRVDVPVREELSFTVALDMGVFRLWESSYLCVDDSGEQWELIF
jgi:hypothetical protein